MRPKTPTHLNNSLAYHVVSVNRQIVFNTKCSSLIEKCIKVSVVVVLGELDSLDSLLVEETQLEKAQPAFVYGEFEVARMRIPITQHPFELPRQLPSLLYGRIRERIAGESMKLRHDRFIKAAHAPMSFLLISTTT